MMPTKEKEVWIRIISVYRDSCILWDITNKNYLNRGMKERGYQVLLDIYKEWDEEATVDLIKKKIKNMRTSYARELKKVKSSAVTDTYIPTLWYYDMFSFLKNITERSFDGHLPINEVCCEVTGSSSTAVYETTEQSSDSDAQSDTEAPRKKTRKSLSTKAKGVPKQQYWKNKQEDWEVLGKSIGVQLKDVNREQLTIVNKLISDVIFYAKSGKLTMESEIILGSPDQGYPSGRHHNVEWVKPEYSS